MCWIISTRKISMCIYWKLAELDKKAKIAEDDAKNVINELTVQLENHGVVFDKLIECQRIYYESEKGITLFTGSILKENYTELIDCFQGQIKQYQSTIILHQKLGDLYHCKAEFSKHL
ncbi:unnamed protein product [Schistosoma bovis]|nr:unnamed protein product [Schistosoma bovis]